MQSTCTRVEKVDVESGTYGYKYVFVLCTELQPFHALTMD